MGRSSVRRLPHNTSKLQFVALSPVHKTKPLKTFESFHTVSKPIAIDAYMDNLSNGATEGIRNDMATKLIGYMLGNRHRLIGSYDRTDNDPVAKAYFALRIGLGNKINSDRMRS